MVRFVTGEWATPHHKNQEGQTQESDVANTTDDTQARSKRFILYICRPQTHASQRSMRLRWSNKSTQFQACLTLNLGVSHKQKTNQLKIQTNHFKCISSPPFWRHQVARNHHHHQLLLPDTATSSFPTSLGLVSRFRCIRKNAKLRPAMADPQGALDVIVQSWLACAFVHCPGVDFSTTSFWTLCDCCSEKVYFTLRCILFSTVPH